MVFNGAFTQFQQLSLQLFFFSKRKVKEVDEKEENRVFFFGSFFKIFKAIAEPKKRLEDVGLIRSSGEENQSKRIEGVTS